VNKDNITERTIKGLIKAGLIPESDIPNIVSRFLMDVEYSYPVPTLKRDNILNTLNPYLESCNIFSRGRFGTWLYETGSMDQSFMQGVEAVDRLVDSHL
jgi:hypothetical protein